MNSEIIKNLHVFNFISNLNYDNTKILFCYKHIIFIFIKQLTNFQLNLILRLFNDYLDIENDNNFISIKYIKDEFKLAYSNEINSLIKSKIIYKENKKLYLLSEFKNTYIDLIDNGIDDFNGINMDNNTYNELIELNNKKYSDFIKFLIIENENINIPKVLLNILYDEKLIINKSININYKNKLSAFGFIISDFKVQIVTLIDIYLKSLFFYDDKKNYVFEITNLICILNILEENKKYKKSDLFKNNNYSVLREILNILSFLGIYIEIDDNYCIINPKFKNILTSDILHHNFDFNIIIQQDFKLFTKNNNSELLINILDLFSEIKELFPDVIISEITKEKILYSKNQGIRIEEIIYFWEWHLNKNHEIPNNILMQVKIWYNEIV